MAASQTWPLFTAPPTPPLPVSSPDDPGIQATKGTIVLGFGLLRPLRRDQKQDFASGGDVRLIKSAVGQILGTMSSAPGMQGEIPWRPEFGSQLYRMRMSLNDVELQAIGRRFVAEALTRWEPRIRIKRTHFTQHSVLPEINNVLAITVFYDIVGVGLQNNQVLFSGSETVAVPLLAAA